VGGVPGSPGVKARRPQPGQQVLFRQAGAEADLGHGVVQRSLGDGLVGKNGQTTLAGLGHTFHLDVADALADDSVAEFVQQ
jgi:hypothetical protein